MKLIIYEIKKVFSQRVFLVVVLLLLIINSFILICTQNNSSYNYKSLNSTEYGAIISKYMNLSNKEASKRVKERLISFEILSNIENLAYADDAEFAKDTAKILKKYKQENPKAYSKAEKMSKSSKDFTTEKAIFQDISNQLEYIESYPSFINEMDDRAERQSKAKLFNNENSFSYKNLFKTADDYRKLKNAELKIGKNNVALAVGNFQITDYFIIAILFLVCVYLFNVEKDNGLYNLVRSTKRGRFPTILSKLTALIIISLIVSIIFIVLNFISTSFIYGADSLSNQIQSFSEFRNCILNIKVWQYVLLFVLSKSFNALAFSFVFALIFICLSNALAKYLSCGIVISLEYSMYAFIPADTPISFLKHINIFYFIDSQKLLSKYLNLNIFGEPVNIFDIDIFTIVFILLIFSAVVSIYFTFKHQKVKSSPFNTLSFKIKSKFYKINGSTSLIKNELFKYLLQNKTILVFLALAVFSLMNCTGNETYVYHSKADYIYQTHMRHLEGQITPEKIQYISEKEQYIKKLEKKINEESIPDSIVEVLQNTIENETTALNRVKNQYKRIKTIQGLDSNAKFIDENIYSRFIYDSQREWFNLVFACLMIIITIPIIYTNDYNNNVIKLLRPTKQGKLRLWLSKVTIGVSASNVIFAFVYIPYIIRFINGFGTSSFMTSIQSIKIFESSVGLSVINAFIVEHLTYMFITVTIFSVVTLISVFLENNLVSMLLSSVVIIIPLILINGNESIRVGKIFSIGWQLPYTLIVLFCIAFIIVSLIISGNKFTQTKLLQRRN